MIRALVLLAFAAASLALAQTPQEPQTGRYRYVDKETVFDTATGKIVRFDTRRGGREVESGFIEIDPIKGTVVLRRAKVIDERIPDFPDAKLPSYASARHTVMTLLRALRRGQPDLARGCFGPKSLAKIAKRRGGITRMLQDLRREEELYTLDLDALAAMLQENPNDVLYLCEVQPGVWKFETQSSGVDEAAGTLRTISTAQSLFREGDKDNNQVFDYAGSLDALIQVGLLATSARELDGYRIEVWAGSEAPEFLWGAVAIPAKPGPNAPYLIVNQAGVIYASPEQPKLDRVKCEIDQTLPPYQQGRRR